MASGNKKLKIILAIVGGVFVFLLICVVVIAFIGYRVFFAHHTQRMKDMFTSNVQERRDAMTLMNGGEWIVKYTDNDSRAPNGISFGSSCEFTCPDSETASDGIDIRFGKGSSSNDVGSEAVCVLRSHGNYSSYASLRRGDRVRFEFSEDPLQDKCRNAAMFLTIRKQ